MSRSFIRAAALAASLLTLAGCGGGGSTDAKAEEQETTTTVAHAAHWGYEGESGPDHWAELDPLYKKCVDGSAQTPINIVDAEPVDLVDPLFKYHSDHSTVINNGHTIQANAGFGSTVTVDGVIYPLAQIHFHTPSEHEVQGRLYPVEVHFVHKTQEGKLAVVGVFLEQGPAQNQAWDPYVKALTATEEHPNEAWIDWAAMLPQDHTTFRYSGSLTTPPCSEGVSWMVMTTPVQVSSQQIAAFEKVFGHNNRPTQAVNGRSLVIDSSRG